MALARAHPAHVLVTIVVIALLTGAAALVLVSGENERASSPAAPLDIASSHRRVVPVPPAPLPTTTTVSVAAPPVVSAPAPPEPAPVAAPEPVPEPEPESAPPATTVLSGAAGQLVGLINGARAGVGLAPYAVDGELTAGAQSWAQSMAAAGAMSHRADLSGGLSASWVRLGENVGVGADVGVVHDALMASPGHYANIVDPSFGAVGVGVVESGGTLYVVEEFMQL